MVKKSVRESLYFLLLAVLFYLGIRVSNVWKKSGMDENLATIITVVICTLILVSVYFLSGINSNKESFWDVSDAAKCKGGNWYNWQGDDPISTKCRELSETTKGQCEIAAYSCPYGYQGLPKTPFIYTPLSGDDWRNERCENKQSCSCTPKHDEKDRFTSFERTIPF